MDFFDILGILGGIIGVLLYLPQISKSYHTKHTENLSWGTYILILINDIFWTTYGLGRNNPVIFVPNGISIALCICIILQKRIYDSVNRKLA